MLLEIALVLSIWDGDSYRIESEVAPDLYWRAAVRLNGVDAPELRGRCPAERAKAEQAKQRVEALILGRVVSVLVLGPDKFGARWQAEVTLPDGRDLKTVLVEEGLVAEYSGRGPRRDWCAVLPS